MGEFYPKKEKNHEELAGIANLATVAELLEPETPYISDEVYASLPEILSRGTSVLTERRERDVFLTGALGVLSGCFPNVYGIYAGNEVYANLYTYINAPAASGKGMLAYARNLGNEYHEQIKATKIESGAKPVLFIPGNTSAAALIGHIQASENNGIFFETEADTVGNTFKQEWGNFSDLLRKGFHHETISSSRKMNNEFIEIESPKLSIVLSGTPEQIHNLIPSAENGLFSRFVFYAYKSELQWKDVSPMGANVNYKEFYSAIGKEVLKIVNLLLPQKVQFQLTEGQWLFLNGTQKNLLKEIVDLYGEGAASMVKRLGLIWFRIAMILSACRQYSSKTDSPVITCIDTDFHVAHDLLNTYKQHMLYMYNSLPKQVSSEPKDRTMNFFRLLPSDFTRKVALSIGERQGLSQRTIDSRLKMFYDKGLLNSAKSGYYSKSFSKN